MSDVEVHDCVFNGGVNSSIAAQAFTALADAAKANALAIHAIADAMRFSAPQGDMLVINNPVAESTKKGKK